MIYEHQVGSPVGDLRILASERALVGVYFLATRGDTPRGPTARDVTPRGTAPGEGVPLLREAERQLAAYFAGQLQAFELPLEAEGTPHERAVWQALRDIPYGRTESYGGLARKLARPSAARAVGRANAHNPLAVIVPCHRVIGADGSLTGYAGGTEIKRWLLAHEARHAAAPSALASGRAS